MWNPAKVLICLASLLLCLSLASQCEAGFSTWIPRMLLRDEEYLPFETDKIFTAEDTEQTRDQTVKTRDSTYVSGGAFAGEEKDETMKSLESPFSAAEKDQTPRFENVAATAETKSNRTRTSSSKKKTCDATYGVLPCSTTVIGNLFLLLAYGFLLYKAARFLTDGSELLLTCVNPGIIGGLLLPILGVLPDSLLILVSGIGGTNEEAQEEILVGIGLLAGSTVMLLTLLWGTCLILGHCDLEESSGRLTAVDKKLTKGWSLKGTGVTTDYLTKLSSRIMVVTVLPFIVAQLPKIFRFSATGNIPVLIACVLALGGLVAYCLYQVFSPKVQKRKKAYAKEKFHKLFLMRKFVKWSIPWGNLINERGEPDMNIVDKMFTSLDLDNDDHLSAQELRYLMNLSMIDPRETSWIEEAVEHIMNEFDVTGDKKIARAEFDAGMKKWLMASGERRKPFNLKEAENAAKRAEGDYVEFLSNDEDEEEEDRPFTKKQLITRAVLLLVGGTILAAAFADPLVDAVTGFSRASHIPAFFISFVLLPLASNSSEGVSSLMFSARKKKKNMSLTYSQIYGGVTMNNTVGLGIFLAVVYGRHLVWDFSAEVLVIVFVTVVMGLMTGFRNTFPLWMAGIALALYPISLGLVAVLDYVAGWE